MSKTKRWVLPSGIAIQVRSKGSVEIGFPSKRINGLLLADRPADMTPPDDGIVMLSLSTNKATLRDLLTVLARALC